jgi:hypothetical protein
MCAYVQLRRYPLMICAMGWEPFYPLDDWAVVQREWWSIAIPGLGTVHNDAGLFPEDCPH